MCKTDVRSRTRSDGNRSVVEREDLTWPKLTSRFELRRDVAFRESERERAGTTIATRRPVCLRWARRATGRKGNGVTCESSGTRNVFAKTGGSCGGGPDVFTTRIRLYKTVPGLPIPRPLPVARLSPLLRGLQGTGRCNVDTMRSAETKNS